MHQQVSYYGATMEHQSEKTAIVTRITPLYGVYAEDETGRQYGFRLDRLSGYDGRPLKQFGLVRGRRVTLQLAPDERVISAQLLAA